MIPVAGAGMAFGARWLFGRRAACALHRHAQPVRQCGNQVFEAVPCEGGHQECDVWSDEVLCALSCNLAVPGCLWEGHRGVYTNKPEMPRRHCVMLNQLLVACSENKQEGDMFLVGTLHKKVSACLPPDLWFWGSFARQRNTEAHPLCVWQAAGERRGQEGCYSEHHDTHERRRDV